MNLRDNDTLKNLKKRFKRNEKKVYYLPIEPFRPNAIEENRIRRYARLLGYHVKWNTAKQVPMLFSPEYRFHGYLQKDNTLIFIVFRDKREAVINLDDASLRIIEKFAEKKKRIKDRFVVIKQGLKQETLRKHYGIELFPVV